MSFAYPYSTGQNFALPSKFNSVTHSGYAITSATSSFTPLGPIVHFVSGVHSYNHLNAIVYAIQQHFKIYCFKLKTKISFKNKITEWINSNKKI